MMELSTAEQLEFKKYSLRVSLTNIVQFLLFFAFIFPYYQLTHFYFDSIILPGLLLTLLMVDLLFTTQFLQILATSLKKQVNQILLLSYVLVSASTRIYIVYNLTFGTTLFGNYLYLVALVAVLFGLNLFNIVVGEKFRHDDKLKTLMWANLTGITVIFGNVFLNIFTGIKFFLPLFGAFVYFVMAYDFGRLPVGEREIPDDETDLEDIEDVMSIDVDDQQLDEE